MTIVLKEDITHLAAMLERQLAVNLVTVTTKFNPNLVIVFAKFGLNLGILMGKIQEFRAQGGLKP